MGMVTYLPKFAQSLHKAGKYAYIHKAKMNAVLDASDKLTDEEKSIAKKAIDDVIAAYAAFEKIWDKYSTGN